MAKYRSYPKHTLEQASAIAQTVADQKAGKPMKRLMLADALNIKPSSSNYRDLLSSSRYYGLTEGTEKALSISLTDLGRKLASNPSDRRARREAVLQPKPFHDFFESYDGSKVPSQDVLKKVLVDEHGITDDGAEECAELIIENGRYAGIIREISGSPHVVLDGDDDEVEEEDEVSDEDFVEDHVDSDSQEAVGADSLKRASVSSLPPSARPKDIFVGHGKKKGPLEKLTKLLDQFQIPFKVAEGEPNLGRPIPGKVKQTMEACGSAILIFTKDEKFFDEDGNEVWRPSENVVHELGAASYAYEDRVVIFKEKGIDLPSNFSSIGYIEFEEDGIESKTADLLKELIGFGLVRITPAA